MAPPRELLDALAAERGAPVFRAMDGARVLTDLFPELEQGRLFVQPELHFYDVLDHNLAAVAALDAALGEGSDGDELRAAVDWVDWGTSLEREIGGVPLGGLVRLAALLHDVAKPATATMVDGRLRFPRHGPRGAELMAERLPTLGFGEEQVRLVCSLIRYHLRPGELVRAWPPSDKAVRRFVTDLDGHVLPLMLVNLADGMAVKGPHYTRESYRRHCGFINYVLARSWGVSEGDMGPLVTGDDLMAEMGMESGRLLGGVLTSVRRAQLEGTIATRDEAFSLARKVLANLAAEAG